MDAELPNAKYEHVYAILRADEGLPAGATLVKDLVMVKVVVRSREEAEREVARLNRLNAGKGCEYFYQVTRLQRERAELVRPPERAAGREEASRTDPLPRPPATTSS
jgi:hypothetical protein